MVARKKKEIITMQTDIRPDLAVVVHMLHVRHRFWLRQTNVVFVNLANISKLLLFHLISHHNDLGIASVARNKH